MYVIVIQTEAVYLFSLYNQNIWPDRFGFGWFFIYIPVNR